MSNRQAAKFSIRYAFFVKHWWVLMIGLLSMSTPYALAQNTVVVISLGGDKRTVAPSARIVSDTPGRGNYQLLASSTIVQDLTTGLRWTKRRTSSAVTWAEAVDYCSELVFDSEGKIWRLPEIDELTTLFRFDGPPYLETSIFLSSERSYWSNTVAAQDVSQSSDEPSSRWIAWFTDIRPRDHIEPEFIGASLDLKHYARCVADPI